MSRPTIDQARAALNEAAQIGKHGSPEQRSGRFDPVRAAEVSSTGASWIGPPDQKPMMSICVFISHTADDRWLARLADAPRVQSEGSTPDEALSGVRDEFFRLQYRMALRELREWLKDGEDVRNRDETLVVLQVSAVRQFEPA